ncbi:anti-sigma factor domain-containing protein [Stenotrophomonas sp. WHRI 8082]|uniref:anti-sigma factor n=1 Tax=unclassified Stenotrophomonas TaxID=196198 RepID=UPI001784E646|nr:MULTISPECIES: anti-sigma factor [unclassified Stenotrophomonas]MBD8637239.1 anti-sigma factor [Stenotrophomonas sp. CFBP 13725]MBD8697994.1 anti-sigma factor [Stenotrophomonas sp. CFBP 13718]
MNIRDLQQEDEQPPSADQLAGEYVLGVLDAGQRADAEQRISADAGFARLVSQWEERLAPLLEEVGSAPVPAHVWLRVRRELGWAAFDAAPAPRPWKRTGFWQGATALAAALALVAVFTRPAPEQPLPTPVATTPTPVPASEPEQATRPVTPLLHDDGRAGWLASVDAALGKVLMVPVPSAADAQGRAPELWVIPAGGAPISLGLVSNDRAHTVDVPTELRAALVNGSVLAITLEPTAGAPHAAPTGPVVAKGDIANL